MGIVLNEATIQQAMLAAGFEGNESALRKQFGSLDEGAKAQLRYMAILDQSKDAQTDVTRTSDSYTNSLKGVKGMWQGLPGGRGREIHAHSDQDVQLDFGCLAPNRARPDVPGGRAG